MKFIYSAHCDWLKKRVFETIKHEAKAVSSLHPSANSLF